MVRAKFTLVLFFIFYFPSFYSFGQTVKILFDASQAETAGSADWIIDADLHNLGFGSGPAVLGTGNESNAANIPTPAQSGITAGTVESFWTGALSSWGIDCVKRGYQVESLPYNGLITYGNSSNPRDLSNYKVFIVCEPNIVFTATEKTAIMNFVQNGGGLFMVSDHDVSDRNGDGWDSPHIWNDLMTNNTVQNNPFGISFDYLNFSGTSSNIPSLPGDSVLHGPMGNVTQVMWSNGTSMTLNPTQNNTVKGVVYKTGSSFGNNNVMAAYAHFGSGKVAAIGDSSPADDGTGDPGDVLYDGWIADASGNHEKLIMNMTIWLATSGGGSTAGVMDLPIAEDQVNIFPNPFSDFATIQLNNADELNNASLFIYNMAGQEVSVLANINQSTFTLQRNNLQPGIYFYSVQNNGTSVARGKFVVE